MRLFITTTLLLALTTIAHAEELFTARDFTVTSYTELYDAKADIREKYNQRVQAAKDEMKAVTEPAHKKYKEKKLAALEELRQTDWGNYIAWLDAKERGDYDLYFNMTETVPAIVEYEAKSLEYFREYQKVEDAAKLRYDEIEIAAEYVRELEVLNAEKALKLSGS